VGLLRTLLGRMGSSEPTGPDTLADPDDLQPLESRYASAQAAIDHAIRMRMAAAAAEFERRDTLLTDRRRSDTAAAVYAGPERRGALADRRSRPQAFGRRHRESA